MILDFRNNGLKELFETGKTAKIQSTFHKRVLVRLDRLDQIADLKELKLPGFNFHQLQGFNPKRYTIHVNGPWCITFEFDAGDVSNVDFEQYH